MRPQNRKINSKGRPVRTKLQLRLFKQKAYRFGTVARGCGYSSRDCNGWWIHKCWTVSWWLWHHVGVESPAAVGGFTGARLLAGGCGIVVSCGSSIPNGSW